MNGINNNNQKCDNNNNNSKNIINFNIINSIDRSQTWIKFMHVALMHAFFSNLDTSGL